MAKKKSEPKNKWFKTVLYFTQKYPCFVLLGLDKDNHLEAFSTLPEGHRLIVGHELPKSGRIVLDAYGYPNDKVIADRLTKTALDIFRDHHGLPRSAPVVGSDGQGQAIEIDPETGKINLKESDDDTGSGA